MRWNEALANAVYRPEAAGTPVYLDMEDELLAQVASQVGDTSEEPRQQLTSAVRATLNSVGDSAGVFGQHIRALRRWRPETGDPPPIIGLLAVLCLAAEEMREADGFASNNYYDRLMPLLGIQPSAKDRVVHSYRSHSNDMWETLNSWLEGLHGERGLPTAYAYSHAHVGRPLSQALIRAADREKLYDFFSDQGLEPRSRLSPQDMEPMLSEWIGRVPSPASNQIRALWKRPGARERITDIACQLLETWEPMAGASGLSPVARTTHTRSSLLRLMALLRTFPDTILELNLMGPGLGGDHVVSLVDPNSGTKLGVDFEVEDLPDGRWRLARMDHLEERSLLEGRVCLRQSAGVLFERRPRRLVPLKKDPLLQFFVEVERLGLGEDGLLLCQSRLASWVEDALTKIARPGFRKLDPPPKGCPDGWILFADVQVVGALSSVAPQVGAWPLDLNVLQPVATSQLLLEGGLQLPGRIRRWSSLAPPEIRAASEDAVAISITVEQVGAFQHAENNVLELQTDEPAVVIPLSNVHLPDGDFDLSAEVVEAGSSKWRPLNTMRLRLRSADNPHPLPIGQMRLARPADSMPFGVVSAEPWDGCGAAIRGVAMEGQQERSGELWSTQVGQPGWWTRRQQTRSAPSSDSGHFVRRITLPAAGPEDCFRTGAHYIDLPTFYGKTSKSTIDGICRYCGLVKRYPARHRLRRQALGQSQHLSPPSLDVSSLTSVGSGSAVGVDVTFDALSHDQAGPMAWFEQLALQVEPSQLFADRFLRALESLGHIEVSRDIRNLAAMSWEVPSPVLAGLPGGGFVLTGFRSYRLTKAIKEAAEADGLVVKQFPQAPWAPVCLSINAQSADEAAVIAERVTDRTQIAITIAPDSSYVLARALPALGAVIDALPRQPMVAVRGARRWDSGLARWTFTDDAHVPGCYQLAAVTTIYCLRDEADVAGGTMRRMDARLVKYAAARGAGESMIGYVERNQGLYVPLGADLPGMYGRVAVLCSGVLPTEDEKQRLVHYHKVPREIASHLAALLAA